MGRGEKVFAAAALGSLFVHLALLATVGEWWTLPREEVPFPLEARLDLTKPAPPSPSRAATSREVAAQPTAPTPESAKPDPATTPPVIPPQVAAPAFEPPAAPEAPPAQAAVTPPPAVALAPSPVPVPAPTPAPEPRRSVRALPDRLVLVYDVLAGEGGFNLGQASYTWQARDGRYRLESVAQATGLASLFMSGRILQISEGRVGPAGLVPELFRQSRNERRQDSASFDWERRVLVLPQGEEALRDGAQDLLSFPFHLAMTVAEGDTAWIMPVTNGRRLKGYRFLVLGRERLEAGGEGLETLHVQGSRGGDGSLDVWLAPTRHWLPARIRTQDLKGQVMELTLVRVEG